MKYELKYRASAISKHFSKSDNKTLHVLVRNLKEIKTLVFNYINYRVDFKKQQRIITIISS